jgi:FlaA1/EpsC-like NDP-sugar epimerase
MGILLALLCGFAISLIMTSRRLHLYTPTRLTSFLHEQRLSVQACFTSGLLLTGTLYLVHAEDIPRSIVLITVGLVTIALSLRRLVYRILLYRRLSAAWARATCSSWAPGLRRTRCAIIWRASATWATPSRASSIFPASGSRALRRLRRRGGHARYALPARPQAVCG